MAVTWSKDGGHLYRVGAAAGSQPERLSQDFSSHFGNFVRLSIDRLGKLISFRQNVDDL